MAGQRGGVLEQRGVGREGQQRGEKGGGGFKATRGRRGGARQPVCRIPRRTAVPLFHIEGRKKKVGGVIL
jgi:hypothetical protein